MEPYPPQLKWKIPFADAGAQYKEEKRELLPILDAVLEAGNYIDGPEVGKFEEELAAYVGTKYCVGLNSGTDALTLGMKAAGIGPGDEVITPPNSFVASTSTIVACGASPIFADIRPDGLLDPQAVEAAITPRTAAIMPVHLWGGACDMDALWPIAERHRLAIIEDDAQAMGVKHRDKRCGALGTVGCHSAHPVKIFNAVGDGGFITTDSADIAQRVRVLRNYGRTDRETVAQFSGVSRLDSVQAAVLSFRLRNLEQTILRVRANADLYRFILEKSPVSLPVEKNYEYRTYSYYVIQCDRRDALRCHLTERGIQTLCFYETPLHLQPPAKEMGYRRGQFPVTERLSTTNLALPIYRTLGAANIEYIGSEIQTFLRG